MKTYTTTIAALCLLLAAGVAGAEEDVVGPPEAPSAPLGLSLSWEDLPAVETEERDELLLVIHNGGPEARDLEFTLLAQGLDGRSGSSDLGELSLDRGEYGEVSVSLAELPIQSVGSSSQGIVEISAYGDDGNLVSIFSEAFYYDFDAAYRQATVYDGAGALGRFPEFEEEQLFELQGRVMGADGRFADIGELIGGREEAVVNFGTKADLMWDFDFPVNWPDWPKPEVFTQGIGLCARWAAHYVDAGFGEDHLKFGSLQKVPAAYALAQITKLGSSTPMWSGALNENGCAPVQYLPIGSYVFTLASIHEAPGGQKFTTYHLSLNPDFLGTKPFLYKTGFQVNLVPAQVIQQWIEPVFQTAVTNVSAIVSHLLTRPDHGIVPDDYEIYADKSCPTYPGDSCASSAVWLGPGFGGLGHHSEWKYIVAHEIGHMIQRRAIGSLSNDYHAVVDMGSTTCRCDYVTVSNSLHCLQSLEETTAAQIEGFAQFYAAMTFNAAQQNDCTFVYYKEFAQFLGNPPLFYVHQPPYAHSCAAPVAWRNQCTQMLDSGTEFDWMNFYWQVDSQATIDDIHQIYRDACGGWCYGDTVTWEDLALAAENHFGAGDPAYLNFVGGGSSHEVDNNLN